MIKTQEQLETFKKLDEEGKTLTKSVSWWKEESAKVLEEAEMLSLVEDEEIPFYGQEEFESYLNDMQDMQKRINYLDNKGQKEYAQIKDYENRINKFFVRAAFWGHD